jgi:predicted amidohydrolase
MGKVTIGLAQIHPTLGDLDKNLDIVLEAVEQARGAEVDLLVFPELALTGYFLKDIVPYAACTQESPALAKIAEACGPTAVIIGYVEEGPQHLYYNAASLFDSSRLVHHHRKVYLPTYGMFEEQRYFARGDRFRAADTRFGRMGIALCEDLWHTSAAYCLWQDGADILVVLASSPGRGLSEGEKLTITETWERLNAHYAQMYSQVVVFANRVGYEDGVNFWGGSEVVGPDGRRLAKAPYLETAFVTCSVDLADIRRRRIIDTTLRDEDLTLTLKELQRILEARMP